MSEPLDVERYRADGVTYRVSVHRDYDAESPREDLAENGSCLFTFERDYVSPDRLHAALHARGRSPLADIIKRCLPEYRDGIDVGKFQRWANIYASDEILLVRGLSRTSFGTLACSPFPAKRGELFSGVAIVFKDRWNDLMGEDYAGAVTPADLISEDLGQYNSYLEGDIFGYVIERVDTCNLGHQHFTTVDSCWGFYGSAESTMAEARQFVPGDSEKVG